MRLATYILNSHCRTYTCMYIFTLPLLLVSCMINVMKIKKVKTKKKEKRKKTNLVL